MRVDHENNVKSDNRIKNLRLATHAQNCQNVSLKRVNTTGYLGVCKTKTGKYQAQIEASGIHYALGSSFETAEEAAIARDAAAIRLHGQFAKLNALAASEPKKG